MKKTILLTTITLSAILVGFYFFQAPPIQKNFEGSFGKNSPNFRNAETKSISPYAEFGDSSVVLTTQQERTGTWEIQNPNLKDKIQKFVFHSKSGMLEMFDKKNKLIEKVILPSSAVSRFLRPDRFAEKYYGLSPYQYAANNPIRNIDYNGDSIVVSAGGSSYNYGFTQSGGYGFYDKSGNIYSGNDKYLNAVSGALAKLGLGKEGRGLIDFLSGTSNNIEIQNPLNGGGNQATFKGMKKGIDWDPNNANGGPDASGSTARPSFIGLGHEMAHVEDAIKGTYKQGDFVNDPTNGVTIPNAEIYSTHRENQFRAEQGLPLRSDYTPNYSGSRIIDVTTRSSLYFNSQGGSYFNPANDTYKRVPKGTTPFGY
jgi:hypothetical protein